MTLAYWGESSLFSMSFFVGYDGIKLSGYAEILRQALNDKPLRCA